MGSLSHAPRATSRFIGQRTGTAVALGAALIGAYATYELALFAATPFLGSATNFSVAIVARLGLLNLIWLIGLAAASEAARMLGVMQLRQRPF